MPLDPLNPPPKRLRALAIVGVLTALTWVAYAISGHHLLAIAYENSFLQSLRADKEPIPLDWVFKLGDYAMCGMSFFALFMAWLCDAWKGLSKPARWLIWAALCVLLLQIPISLSSPGG